MKRGRTARPWSRFVEEQRWLISTHSSVTQARISEALGYSFLNFRISQSKYTLCFLKKRRASSDPAFVADSLCFCRMKCEYAWNVLWFGTIWGVSSSSDMQQIPITRLLSFPLLTFLSLSPVKCELRIAVKFWSQCIKCLAFSLFSSYYSKMLSGYCEDTPTTPSLHQCGSEKTKLYLLQKTVRRTAACKHGADRTIALGKGSHRKATEK